MRGEIGKKGGIAAGSADCWQTGGAGRDLATTFTSLTVPASVISGRIYVMQRQTFFTFSTFLLKIRDNFDNRLKSP